MSRRAQLMLVPVLLTLVGCESYHALVPSPVLPLQATVDAGVAIEDLSEDPACDAQTTTVLERVRDVLATPWWLTWTLVAYEGSVAWGLVDFVGEPTARVDFEGRFRQIIRWLPLRFAGVPPWDARRLEPACPRSVERRDNPRLLAQRTGG